MVNVTLTGTLANKDESIGIIRYVYITREYKDCYGQFVDDKIPCIYWSRNEKNELFSLSERSYVALKGRLENFNGLTCLIVESIEYLGIKK